ncbi:beta-ketoacyl-[acyl-carrier-protein] synthase family protein [Crateriforma conspicua]|uniref:3-oxoacyl-[acyl-carrier-protein] synthase 2 n=1 Tax=Crateriforma conspicua TaxID=2527996 RepID=A0A5C5Y8D6_9PLAN|nr:beta-ketoacyl-[acyl-carrier-protein] synthase family protein [Crateriforma conspicua]TWT71937.1 3-oxoacyl-[acyl-carrier-protein] synthase 2 [Crateriforma conspicua]
MHTDPSQRIVITGLGVVTPLGNDIEPLLSGLREGRSGIRTLTRVPLGVLPVNHGAEAAEFTGHIDDYGPLDKTVKRNIRKGSKVMCREIEMGVAVAQRAMADAGFTHEAFDRDRTGVVYGCDYIMSLPDEYAAGMKACLDGEGQFSFTRWGEQGLPKVNPLWLLKYLPNMPASHIAIYNDLRGANNSITVREASAGNAIGEAYSTLRRGHADALVVGSTGSRIHPLRTLHASMQESLASDRDDCESMSRPFNRDRDGGVLGEGAGAMMLETLAHAEKRGAKILGEVVGYGSSAVGPAAGDEYLKTAIVNVLRAALGAASPNEIGHINAHGLGTPQSDAGEAAAIAQVFGDASSQPPVTTVKGHFGNLGAGGGMVEAIASLCSLGDDLFPIRNLTDLDSNCPINAVTGSGIPSGDSFISVNVTPQGQASSVHIRRFAA